MVALVQLQGLVQALVPDPGVLPEAAIVVVFGLFIIIKRITLILLETVYKKLVPFAEKSCLKNFLGFIQILKKLLGKFYAFLTYFKKICPILV